MKGIAAEWEGKKITVFSGSMWNFIKHSGLDMLWFIA